MVKYLKITNSGKVDVKAYQKAGFSTKSDDPTKIGEFGTGANFACLWAIREGLDLKVFSGHREVIFSKVESTFRDEKVEYLVVDGVETSFSITMGKGTWKGWMAIREFWCNALDESDADWTTIESEEEIQSHDDITCIYLEINEEVQDVINNWNEYFSSNRKDLLYTGKGFKLYKAEEYGNLIVYRKGIQCFSYNVPSIFHYDLDDIKVSDSRVVEDKYKMDSRIATILANEIPEELIVQLCKNIKGSYEFNLNWDWYYLNFNDRWSKALAGSCVVEEEYKEEYKSSIEKCVSPIYHLPRNLAKNITTNANVEHVSGIIGSSYEGGEEVLMSNLYKGVIETSLTILENKGYIVHDNCYIKVYKPTSSYIQSTNIKDIIYINEKCVNYDNNCSIVLTNIIRQSENIKAKKKNIELQEQLLNTLLTKLNIINEVPRNIKEELPF